jgi:(p)ppGpp synthase/HD superfamily hydrolase
MSADVIAVARALDFAARKHSGQRRKGKAAEPYVNHITDVARMVAEATEGRDAVAVVAALLHDTIEDTCTTREELEREFGAEVASLVAEVTDDKGLPKPERKRLQVVSAPGKSARAKIIKLADKTSNLRSMTASPPVGWDWQRQRDYFEWAGQVAQGCRGVNTTLEKWFDEARAEGIAALERPR